MTATLPEPEPLGPPSDFGWRRCHGCEALSDEQGRIIHAPDCPGLCIRPHCTWHGKGERGYGR